MLCKFKKVTLKEMEIIIKELSNTSSGYDLVKANFLKQNINFFATTLTKLINEILESGKFPGSLKISRIKPIPKDGASTDVTNYRQSRLRIPSANKCFKNKKYHSLLVIKIIFSIKQQ
jgi:hypothetical protein